MDSQIIALKDVLYRLQEDKGLLLELIDIFIEDVPHRLEEARQRIDQGQAAELADVAHSLKGASSNIGANKLWQTFKDMEQAAQEQHLDQARQLFEKALKEFAELQEYVPQLKSQLAA